MMHFSFASRRISTHPNFSQRPSDNRRFRNRLRYNRHTRCATTHPTRIHARRRTPTTKCSIDGCLWRQDQFGGYAKGVGTISQSEYTSFHPFVGPRIPSWADHWHPVFVYSIELIKESFRWGWLVACNNSVHFPALEFSWCILPDILIAALSRLPSTLSPEWIVKRWPDDTSCLW